MAPDVEELIKRVNTLTLDKNRLKQKLLQLTNEQNGKDTIMMSFQHQSQDTTESSAKSINHSSNSISNTNTKQSPSPANDRAPTTSSPSSLNSKANYTVGVECATSSEDDLLYMNDLFKKRLDEYEDKWSYIQSKCSALQSELTALQTHYARLKREKLELEEKYQKKCEDCDDVKSELKTVVLNYETQLSTMSDHLSSLSNGSNQF